MRWTNVQTCAGTVSDIQLVCWLAIAIAFAFAIAIAFAVATPTKQLAGGKATRMGGGVGTEATAGASGFGLTLANGYATFCLCSAGAGWRLAGVVWHVARDETNGSVRPTGNCLTGAPAMATKEQTTRNAQPASHQQSTGKTAK